MPGSCSKLKNRFCRAALLYIKKGYCKKFQSHLRVKFYKNFLPGLFIQYCFLQNFLINDAVLDLPFSSTVKKIYPFAIIYWVNTDEIIQSNKFIQPKGQHFSQSLTNYRFFKTTAFQAKPKWYLFFKCSNTKSRIKCEIYCSSWKQKHQKLF